MKDPTAFKRTLERLGGVIPGIAERISGKPIDFATPRGGEGFYALSSGDEEIAVYGVVDDVFVIATDAERAGRLAKARPEGVEGASGSLVGSADAALLVRELVGALTEGAVPEIAGRLLTGPLDDANGSVSASEDGLEGRLFISLD